MQPVRQRKRKCKCNIFDDIKIENLELRFWKNFRQKIQQTVFSEQKLLLSEDVEFWKMITLNFSRNLLEKVGGAIGGTRPMVDSEMIPFNHQIGQTGLTIRRRSVSPLVYPEQFSIQKESRIQIYMLQSIQTKMLRFLSCRLRNPGRFKRNSGELPDTVI